MRIERVTEATDELVAALAQLVPQVSSRGAPDRAAVERLVRDGDVHQLVARDEAIVGALTLVVYPTPSGLKAAIEDVVVDETARGRGIGVALVEEAKARAAAAGAVQISLTSHPRREAANRLYRRLGFEQRDTNVYVWRAG